MTLPSAIKRLILIVDDDQLLLEFLGEVLRHAGYETMLASSAEDALSQIAVPVAVGIGVGTGVPIVTSTITAVI